MPTFTRRDNFNNTNRGTNGGHRVGGLFADAAGDFSGTTAPGGANNDGTVFDSSSIGPAPSSAAPTRRSKRSWRCRSTFETGLAQPLSGSKPAPCS
jgi:hypothetical protein